MSTIEQAARQAAEWILDPKNGAGLPAKGERLWLSILGGRVVAWQSAKVPHSPAWVAIAWRPEFDKGLGNGLPGARRLLTATIARALRDQAKRAAS